MSSNTSEESLIDLKNAVRSGNKDLVVKLLDQGVDPNQFGRYSGSGEPKSPLMVACEHGHGEIAEVLIARGAKVDLENVHHHTALSQLVTQAVSSENLEIIKLLLKHKAKVRFRGESAVRIACKRGNFDLVKLLVPHDSWDDPGYIYWVFYEAINIGHTNCNVVKFLLQSEQIDIVLVKLVHLLHDACKMRDDPEMVKILLDKKPDIVNCIPERSVTPEEMGFSALMQATAKGHIRVVKLLLDRGADVDYQSTRSSTESHYTYTYMDLEGVSALMVACVAGNLELVKLLLEKGAKVDLRTKTGKTALMLSTITGRRLSDVSWSSRSSTSNSVEIIQQLLSKSSKVNFQDEVGGTALVYAVRDQLLEAVKLLLDKKAELDIVTDHQGTPPFNAAIRISRSHPEIARLLLERGAPVDLQDRQKKTPLIIACEEGNAELVKLLTEKEVNINHLDHEGGYALLYAVRYAVQHQNSNLETIELLLEKGAKASAAVTPENGDSALSILKDNVTSLLNKIESKNLNCPELVAILRSTEEVKSKVDDKKELQPPDGSSEGDEIFKVAEQNDETADPKITVELPDPQKSKGQDESNSSRENSRSDSTNDDEQQSMSEEDDEDDKFPTKIEDAVSSNEKISRKLAHGILVGPIGSGKSSLMDRLLGRQRKKFSPSTGVSEPVVVVDVDIDNPSTFHSVTVIDHNTWTEVEYGVSLLRQMDEGVVTSQSDNTSTSPPPAKRAKIESETAPDAVPVSTSPQQNLPNADESGSISPVPTTPTTKPRVLPTAKIVRRAIKKFGGYKKFKRFLKKSISLYLRDTGGQVAFQEMMPLLISGPSIVFFVFRLDVDFKKKFEVKYWKSAGESLNCYISSITTEEAFLQSLATVDAMEMSGEASVKTHKPLVFVIGTHRDRLGASADKKIAELNEHLSLLIDNSGFRDLVQYADRRKGHVMFTVDNTSEGDEDFKLIRSRVSNMIRDREEFTIEYPIRYLLFCLELQNLNRSILSLDECKVMAAKYGINEDQLVHLLQFLHLRIGVIRYFDKDGVRHIVIKEPQILFNNVTDLIIKTFSCEALTDTEAEEFEKKGILTASVLATALKNLGDITPEEFLQLLVHLRITAPFSPSENPSEEKRYFFPSVLNHVPESTDEEPSPEILPLAVTFKCGYCPKGLFGVLVIHLMTPDLNEGATSHSTTFTLMQDKIFKDQVSFEVHSPAGVHDEMALKLHPSHLEIKFFPEHSEDRHTSITEVCNNVRQIVKTSIHQSLQDLHYSDSKVAPVICFRCDDCLELHEVDEEIPVITTYYKKTCTTKPIPDQARCWYGEDLTCDSARRSSSPVSMSEEAVLDHATSHIVSSPIGAAALDSTTTDPAAAINNAIVSSPSHPDPPTTSALVGDSTPVKAPVSRLADQPPSERKFNLMFYGVPECHKGTRLCERADNDLKNVLGVLEEILPSVSHDSIRDCSRVGKYSPQGTRPLLVQFVRARDVRIILQKLSPDVLPSGITIKRHMSSTEMRVKSVLLKKRWEFHTQAGGVGKDRIKLRGNKLFIDSRLVGEVVDGVYKSII